MDFLDSGASLGRSPQAGTTVTRGSVLLLQVINNLLYTIKGIYCLMSMKSYGVKLTACVAGSRT